MRIFFIIIFIFTSKLGLGNCLPDTITNWQIYYGEKLVTAGNQNKRSVPTIGEITIEGKPQELKISYNYDAANHGSRRIVIKSGRNVLYDRTHSPQERQPMLVDMKEIVRPVRGKKFYIQIYYSDNLTKEEKFISEIRVIVK